MVAQSVQIRDGRLRFGGQLALGHLEHQLIGRPPGLGEEVAVWGAGVVSTIDNVLRPLFAGQGAKVSGMTLFLGMFGGMAAFGLVGLFLGPILLYMTRELLAILRRDIYEAPPDARV